MHNPKEEIIKIVYKMWVRDRGEIDKPAKFLDGNTLILSDIHSNIEGLDAVLKDAKGRYRNVLCLGDVIGYGANPNEVVEGMRELEKEVLKRGGGFKVLAGNHEELLLIEGDAFRKKFEEHSIDAQESILWTKKVIKNENVEWLRKKVVRGGQIIQEFETDKLYAAHSGPKELRDGYIKFSYEPANAANLVKQDILLVGHKHTYEEYNVGGKRVVSLPSAGQPRDFDPRVGYAIHNPKNDTLEIFRVHYDSRSAARKIRESGMPEKTAQRLAQRVFRGG